MTKLMTSLRIEPGLKAFIREYAEKDRRTFSNFLIQSAIERIKQKWGVEWEEVREDYPDEG